MGGGKSELTRWLGMGLYLLAGCGLTSAGLLLIRKGGGVVLPWKYALASAALLPCAAAGIWAAIRPGVKPERLFLCLFLGLGLVWSLAMTPFSPPDEGTHYFRVLRISDTLFFRNTGTADTIYTNCYGDYDVHVNSEYAAENVLRNLGQRPTGTSSDIPSEAVWLPDYAPCLVGLTLGRALGASLPVTLLLGRWCGLLACAALLWLALKITPRYKPLLALCALTPMALQIAITLSYDSMILGLSALLLAVLLRLVTGEGPVPVREMVALVVVAVLLTISKPVYAAPALLALAIPRERLSRGKKAAWGGLLVACVAVTALLAGLSLSAGKGGPNWEGEYNYTPAELLRAPKKLVKILLDTVWYNKGFYLYGAVGQYLSGLSLMLPTSLARCWVALLVLCGVCGEKRTLKLSGRLLLLGGCLLVGLALLLIFLFGYTSNTRALVEGVQGRYFTPLLAAALIALGCGKLSLEEKWFPLWLAPAGLLQIWSVAELLALTM